MHDDNSTPSPLDTSEWNALVEASMHGGRLAWIELFFQSRRIILSKLKDKPVDDELLSEFVHYELPRFIHWFNPHKGVPFPKMLCIRWNHWRTAKEKVKSPTLIPLANVEWMDLDTSDEEYIENKELMHTFLREAISLLSDDDYVAIHAYYWSGKTLAEVSKMFDCSGEWVRIKLLSAQERMHKYIKQKMLATLNE